MLKLKTLTVVAALAMSGCTNVPTNVAPAAGATTTSATSATNGVDGMPCTGTINSDVPGLTESANGPLMAQALRPTGKGYLCSAKVFSVTQPVRVYRLIDSKQPYSKLGNFWSFDRPTGTRDDYRAKFGVCKQWSQLDRLLACDVRPGTQIVVGTTQSADCGDGITYAKTPANQVFVPNDGLAGIVHTGACVDQGAWPPGGN